jgi:hypothetical protein
VQSILVLGHGTNIVNDIVSSDDQPPSEPLNQELTIWSEAKVGPHTRSWQRCVNSYRRKLLLSECWIAVISDPFHQLALNKPRYAHMYAMFDHGGFEECAV